MRDDTSTPSPPPSRLRLWLAVLLEGPRLGLQCGRGPRGCEAFVADEGGRSCPRRSTAG